MSCGKSPKKIGAIANERIKMVSQGMRQEDTGFFFLKCHDKKESKAIAPNVPKIAIMAFISV